MADNGCELLEPALLLIEACAVFAETEAVGGPDTKIDLGGGLTGLNVADVSERVVCPSKFEVLFPERTVCLEVDLVEDAAVGKGKEERELEAVTVSGGGALLLRPMPKSLEELTGG